jgi:hypothetical protein
MVPAKACRIALILPVDISRIVATMKMFTDSTAVPTCVWLWLTVLVACVCHVPGARSAVVLNEVLYDPAGADGGHEYVELYNNGTAAVDLEHLSLEFANGAVGDQWAVRWRGHADDVLLPGEVWLIVDQGWAEEDPDAVAALGLQNGPDAIRLTDREVVIDLLGYGALEEPALYEAVPHPGTGSGRALARHPDGFDTDHNDVDWLIATELTPGAPNVRLLSLSVESVQLDPPSQLVPTEAVTLTVVLLNNGLNNLDTGHVSLEGNLGTILTQSDWELLAPGEQRMWSGSWDPLDSGLIDLTLVVETTGLRFNLPAGQVWIGVPELTFGEVMPAPESSAPEWFELVAVHDTDLAGWSVADDGGSWKFLTSLVLTQNDRAVVTADRDAHEMWIAQRIRSGAPWPCSVDPERNVVTLTSSWPTLNNTAGVDADRADRLLLRRPDGLIVDHVAWGGRYLSPQAGRSLERIAVPPHGDSTRNWNVCTAVFGSTPGCRNSSDPYGGTQQPLQATPKRFPSNTGTTFRFQIIESEYSWDLALLDLNGQVTRRLGGDELGAGPRSIVWGGENDQGGPVRPGPWIALLRTRSWTGSVLRRERVVVVVERGRP